MTYGELKKMLKNITATKTQEGARHEMWYNPITGKTFPIGRHQSQEVAKGTLHSILTDSGLK